MRILKQLTRKKNAFFRGIKFNLINYRYRNKPARKAFDPAAVRRVLLLRLDDKVGDMVVTTGCAVCWPRTKDTTASPAASTA